MKQCLTNLLIGGYLLLACSLTASAQTQEKKPIRSGPMLGYADLVEAVVWLQTWESAEVRIDFQTEGVETRSQTVHTKPDTHFIARFTLSNLKDSSLYNYKLFVDGKEVSFSYPLTFKTQTFWQHRTDPPPVKFIIGSCFYVNHPTDDRPGTPYGGEFEVFDHIYKQKGDFMIWLGDNIYFREPDFNAPNYMVNRYNEMRAFPQIQPLWAAMPHYAIWDDHDFGPNDGDRAYPFKEQTLDLFKLFWANPHYGMPDTPGVFGRMQWADLDFFFLDDRYYRAGNNLKDPSKPYLGEKQLEWLKDSLVTSMARFKFIVIGNQMTNKLSGHEAYVNYPVEYNNLMTWLDGADVNGVVILSGDRHFTELLKQDRRDNYPIYEFTSSPLTSGMINKMGQEENNPMREPGTLVKDRRNFGVIQVTGTKYERVLTLQTYDSTGKLRWEKVIPRSELERKMPRKPKPEKK